jgi:hypothetical protein
MHFRNRKIYFLGILVFILILAGGYLLIFRKSNNTVTNAYDGRYDTDTGNFLIIKTIDGITNISGQASWTGDNTTNMGEINGPIKIFNNQAIYDNDGCVINLKFSHTDLTAKETNPGSCGGLNVTFDGTYIKK